MIKITTVNSSSFKLEAFGRTQIKPKGYENFVSGDDLQVASQFDNDDILIPYVSYTQYEVDGVTFANVIDLQVALSLILFNTASEQGATGYSSTKAFVGKPSNNNYNWLGNAGINYTQNDVDNGLFKVFGINEVIHLAKDNPYWTTPTPSGTTGIGLFQGANLPSGVTSLFDYNFDFDTSYPTSSGTGFEGSTGRIKLNNANYGDLLKVRFDFNIIPQIANTTVEPALWYSNRNASTDVITATFPLTAQPIFYGAGTVGNSYLNRVEISAWITSDEDLNALTLPAIKSDNPVIVQPIGMLVTLVR